MTRVKNPRGKAKESRKTISVLDRLKLGEADTVLRRLLTAHPDLGAEAEQIARSVLGEVSFESVADEVEDALRAFDLDDLNSRAGRHSWGYTEPTEAAWQLLEEALEPFLEDMRRQMELGLEAEALEICKGVVLGLYRLREEHGEFLGWAPDFPAEAASDAVAAWSASATKTKKGAGKRGLRKRPAFPQDFVNEFVPEWNSLIAT